MPDQPPFVVQPRRIAGAVSVLNEDFRLGAQEDAHEFYHCFLEAVSSGLLPGSAKSLRETDKATTALHQLCQGVTASQVACPKCEYTKTNFESFAEGGLSLEITAATDTLEEMLEAFTCPERLDKENKLTCSGCQQKVRASKQLSLYQAPNILCITLTLTLTLTLYQAPNILCMHLKRFRQGFQGKVNKPIQFPAVLHLRHFMTPGTEDIVES